MTARTLSFVLALWEFFAAFAIPRTRPAFAAAWTLGLLGAILSVVAIFRARARFGTLAVGTAVLASAFVLQHRTPYAWWNDAIVGSALALLSLVPGTLYSIGRRHATT